MLIRFKQTRTKQEVKNAPDTGKDSGEKPLELNLLPRQITFKRANIVSYRSTSGGNSEQIDNDEDVFSNDGKRRKGTYKRRTGN